jgi:hypothetical protein
MIVNAAPVDVELLVEIVEIEKVDTVGVMQVKGRKELQANLHLHFGVDSGEVVGHLNHKILE